MRRNKLVSIIVFSFVSFILVAGGIIGIGYDIIRLIKIQEMENSTNIENGIINEIRHRNRASENTIFVQLQDSDDVLRVQIGKLLDLEINVGDEVHVLFGSENSFVVKEFLLQIKITHWLRIILFSIGLFLGVFFSLGLKSLIKCKEW